MKIEPNNIYLGNSYELIKEIPDKSIDLIITDPPYEIESLTGGGMAKEKHISNVMDELGKAQLNIGVDEEILNEFMRIMKKPNIYIWCNKKQMFMYMKFFIEKHNCNFVPIVWKKTNAMPLCGGKYLDDCEYCLYFYKGIKLNTTYTTAGTVYEMPINIEDKKEFGHPTIKPKGIIKNLIINSLDIDGGGGGLVFDPFLGSGTTCVAAKELGRKYIGIEINEKYFKIAKDRLNGINAKGQMSLLETNFEQLDLFK